MSKSVILSTGRVTAADDILTITYTEQSDDSPPIVFVRWPRETTPCCRAANSQTPAECCACDPIGSPRQHSTLSLPPSAELGGGDYAALMGAYADRPLSFEDLDVEAQLAAVDDLAEGRADHAARPLGGGGDVLDADFETDGGLPLGQLLVGEDRGAVLHHPDHRRRRQHRSADRSADVGEQIAGDGELFAALLPRLGSHQTMPSPPLTPSVSPVT